jgi:uncharacterized protein (TIGR02145 family)
LKSASGWYPYEGISSTDEFGFSALPGGTRGSGDFYGAGNIGQWWSSTEFEDFASYRNMKYDGYGSDYGVGTGKLGGFSVRCLQDDNDNPAGSVGSSSSAGGGSSSSQGQQQGSGCSDPSATVPIGGQVWLKCNLNVPHNEGNGNSWCYEGTDSSTDPSTELSGTEGCAKYGRLYDWAAAMDLPSKCNSTLSTSDPECAIASPRHKGLCPAGFHVPTNAEWDALVTAADGSWTAGRYLKAQSGW